MPDILRRIGSMNTEFYLQRQPQTITLQASCSSTQRARSLARNKREWKDQRKIFGMVSLTTRWRQIWNALPSLKKAIKAIILVWVLVIYTSQILPPHRTYRPATLFLPQEWPECRRSVVRKKPITNWCDGAAGSVKCRSPVLIPE